MIQSISKVNEKFYCQLTKAVYIYKRRSCVVFYRTREVSIFEIDRNLLCSPDSRQQSKFCGLYTIERGLSTTSYVMRYGNHLQKSRTPCRCSTAVVERHHELHHASMRHLPLLIHWWTLESIMEMKVDVDVLYCICRRESSQNRIIPLYLRKYTRLKRAAIA